jgi:hypothetical protein
VELNRTAAHSSSAGVVRLAAVAALVPFEQAAAQVSSAGAIMLAKRLAAELAVAAIVNFEAFYADRRPAARPEGVGLLITANGSAFPVPPTALLATAKAHRRPHRPGHPRRPVLRPPPRQPHATRDTPTVTEPPQPPNEHPTRTHSARHSTPRTNRILLPPKRATPPHVHE